MTWSELKGIGMFALVACGEKGVVTPPYVDQVAFPSSRALLNKVSCITSERTWVAMAGAGDHVSGHSDSPYPQQSDEIEIVRPGIFDVPAFKIDRAPASCAQWRGCLAAGACSSKPTRPTRCWDDVVIGTYGDAADVCRWRGGRLPTYDEWQRALRGTTGLVSPYTHKVTEKCPPPGVQLDRMRAYCQHTSSDGVEVFFGDNEWVNETRCQEQDEPAPHTLLTSASLSSGHRLDKYHIVLSTPKTADADKQFRCVTP